MVSGDQFWQETEYQSGCLCGPLLLICTVWITEVTSYMSPAIGSPIHSKFISFVLLNLSHFQTLQKIHLVSHIWSMADLLHVNAIQQLEVALLGSPAAQVIDLLAGGWMQTKPVPMTTLV